MDTKIFNVLFKKKEHGRPQYHFYENIPSPDIPDMPTFYIMPEKCHGCGRCKIVCQVGAISGSNKQVHMIDPVKCMRCSHCLEACKHNAIKAMKQ